MEQTLHGLQPPGPALGIWTPRICGERQGITISLAQDVRSKETTTRSRLFHAELLSPTFPCPHFCFTETASPRCVVPPLPAPGEGRAKPFHTQTIPWGSCSGRSPRKALPGLGTTAQLWQETHQAVNTPRLWERNPARPAPLQSLPGCRMPFIQQTSVCPAPLGHSDLVPGSSSAGGSCDFLHGPVLLPSGACKVSPCHVWG